uniref:Galactosyltransferase N-terminal domain-containing protein n=1 Tax=Mola mola TaxID=94237 RepID=A0A3Q4AP37_MOLML
MKRNYYSAVSVGKYKPSQLSSSFLMAFPVFALHLDHLLMCSTGSQQHSKIPISVTPGGGELVSAFMLLGYSQSSTLTYLTRPHDVNENQTLSGIAKQCVDQFWRLQSKHTKANEEKNEEPAKTLGPCPDTPPNLFGSLHVEFDYKRSWDEVRKEVSPLLQEGGRYKPLDCFSKHKVAIIIPFRNRYEHLKHWLYYLHPILLRQQLDYGVYVINQYGEGTFNRRVLWSYVRLLHKPQCAETERERAG